MFGRANPEQITYGLVTQNFYFIPLNISRCYMDAVLLGKSQEIFWLQFIKEDTFIYIVWDVEINGMQKVLFSPTGKL